MTIVVTLKGVLKAFFVKISEVKVLCHEVSHI